MPPSPTASRAALASLLASTLAACAALPAAQPLTSPMSPSDLQSTRALAAPDAEWPTDAWWTAYGDPQLNALIGEALRNSPDLDAAQARLAKAAAAAGQARAGLLPSVQANTSYQSVRQSQNNGVPPAFVPAGFNDNGRLSLDFSYELDLFGKNRAALAAATSDAQAALAETAEARLVLSANIAAAYADLTGLFADRDAAEQAMEARSQTLDLTRQRQAEGLETQLAVEQATGRLAQSRAELAALDEQIGLTRNRLAALMGAGPDRGLSIVRPAVGAPKAFGLPASLSLDLIGRRPDLVAARLRAEAAASRIGEAKASFYPNVNLSAYFGQQALGLDLLTSGASRIAGVGPAISLPIFEGGRLRAGYRGAVADYDAAVATYDGVLTKALQDVADVAVSRRALDVRLAESRAALKASTAAHTLAVARYRGSLSTYLEVLTAEEAMIADQRTVADLETRAFSLDIALIRALGGGYRAA
jgi:NodT family efflux transporter outer membrane factor (OMF) lipoprotein